MTALEIIQVMSLISAMLPEGVKLVNQVVTAFNDTPAEERGKLLDDLAAALKPMIPK